MIFVTVGTHEQQFNRLVEYIDKLKENGKIKDEVIIQTGYSTYRPQYCTWKQWFSYSEMIDNVKKAEIIITHGGPSSFIMPIQIGKIPIVVPRRCEFNEHVNNHQFDFIKVVSERMGTIIPVYDIETLIDIIKNYKIISSSMECNVCYNTLKFNQELEKIVGEMFD